MNTAIKLTVLCSILFFTKIGYTQNSSFQLKDTVAPLSVYQLANKLTYINDKDSNEIRLILSYLSRYTGTTDIQENENIFSSEGNQTLVNIYNLLISNSYNRESLLWKLSQETVRNYKEVRSKVKLKKFLDSLDLTGNNLSKADEKLSELKELNSKFLEISDTTDFIKDELIFEYDQNKLIFNALTVDRIKKDSVLEKVKEKINSVQYEITKNTNLKNELQDSIVNTVSDYKDILTKLYPISVENNIAFHKFSSESIFDKNSTEITIQLAQVESSSEPNYNLSLPSEAEMIDAVAVYLATRVKQEAALWFFDEMKRNAEMYDLLQIFFPNTIDIIQSEDYYKSPTIGTGWQYALARDFTKMPGNVVNSDWFGDLINKYENGEELHQYLQVAVDLAHFYREKFSYKDIVKQLYLNQAKYANDDTNDLKSQPLICSINLLYILSNEFQFYYANEKKKFVSRELVFEDLERMTPKAFSIMISLLNIKYDGIFSEVFDDYKSETILEKKKLYSRWFSRVKITMNQFNKLVKQVNSLNANSNKEEKVYEYYNTWLLFTELLESLDFEDSNLFKLDTSYAKIYKDGKSLIKKSFETYEMIDRKNYVGATNNMLEIIYLFFDSEMIVKNATDKSENQKLLDPLLNSLNENIAVHRKFSNEVRVNEEFFNKIKKKKDSIILNEKEYKIIRDKLPILKRSNLSFEIINTNDISDTFKLEFIKNDTVNDLSKNDTINNLFKTDEEIYNAVCKFLNKDKIKSIRNLIENENVYYQILNLYNANVTNYENNKIELYIEKPYDKVKEFDFYYRLNKHQRNKLENRDKLRLKIKDTESGLKNPKLMIKIKFFDKDTVIEDYLNKNELSKAMHKVKNLASFLADLSETKSSKDIKKTIDAYALPPGSYKRKRNTWHTVDLNAYVGGFLGYEINSSAKTSQSNSANDLDPGFNYGISAPIGFTYTFNFGRKISYKKELGNKYKNNPDLLKIKLNHKKIRVIDRTRSFSVGLSIFDLGAAVSYRFSYDNSDSTNTNAILSNKVRWEQFFSPGVHFSWGIKNTPLVLRAGAQFTPSIRRIRTAQDIEEYKNMFRFYGGIFFDLPIYNIWRNTSITKY